MIDLLDGLNPEQDRAVRTIDGPLLILAGAGSGKTRVLTRRVGYLLEQGIRPWNILAVTFTNKAAGEMKERVSQLVGEAGRDVWVSTFHSSCVRILRREIEHLGYGRNFVIYDDDDQISLLKKILADLKIDTKKHPPQMFRGAIDRAKNKLLDPAEADPTVFRAMDVCRAYEARLKQANALDFNDLVNKVVELWSGAPEVLAHWQDRFRYVMVGEYQDINAAQYRLIRLLADRNRNLAVVGDDDQSIYSFRGADIRNILDFEKDFPDATVVRLEQNYRSTGNILKAASGLVGRNLHRKDKTLWTTAPDGDRLRMLITADDVEEADRVVGEIRQQLGTRRASDFAVIYRTNAQSRPLEQALMAARIPYVLVGGRKFYDRREVKDLLAYLKVIVNPADDISFLRMVNVPARGLGDKALANLQAEATRWGVPLRAAARQLGGAGGRAGNALAAVSLMLDRFERLALDTSPGDLVDTILHDSGYLAMLEAEATEEARGRMENLEELARAAAADGPEEEESLEPLEKLRAFLDRASLSSQADELPPESGGAVTLLTAHLAKGLEYPVVFVVGLAERCFPHARAELEEEIEEERRLAYVAFTRARERLYLSWPQRRRGFDAFYEPTMLSRFVRELPVEVVDGLPSVRPATRYAPPPVIPTAPRPLASFARPAPRVVAAARPDRPTMTPDSPESFVVGVEVYHPMLGMGTIHKREGLPSNPRLTIHFRDHGPRTVFAASAGLEIVRL